MNTSSGRPILRTEGLQEGQEVSVSWTNCGNLYHAYGPISKVNRKSIKITLPEELAGYPAGQEIHISIPGTNLNGAWYR